MVKSGSRSRVSLDVACFVCILLGACSAAFAQPPMTLTGRFLFTFKRFPIFTARHPQGGLVFAESSPQSDGSTCEPPRRDACRDAFVMGIRDAGAEPWFRTAIGGGRNETATGLAVGADGTMWLAGSTVSPDFPVTPAALFPRPTGTAEEQGWLAKFDASGTLLYSTYLPGGTPSGIVLASNGDVVVAGTANAESFVTTEGAYSRKRFSGSTDVFVLRLSGDGSQLIYSTLIGGTLADTAATVSLDEDDFVYVGGSTSSSPAFASGATPDYASFPVTSGALVDWRGEDDVFVLKLSPNGVRLIYSAVFGGSKNDALTSASTYHGALYFSGWTESTDFPSERSPVPFRRGLIGKLSEDGTHLVFAKYFGDWEVQRIVADENGEPVFLGMSPDAQFLVTPEEITPCSARRASLNWYVARLDAAGERVIYGRVFPPALLLDAKTVLIAGTRRVYETARTSAPDSASIECVLHGASRNPTALVARLVFTIAGFGIGGEADGVLVGGLPATVLERGNGWITAVAPAEIAGQQRVLIEAEREGIAFAGFEADVIEIAPELFTASGSGVGLALARNEDGSMNGRDSPAPANSILTLFATGLAVSERRIAVDFPPAILAESVGPAEGMPEGVSAIRFRVPERGSGAVPLSLFASSPDGFGPYSSSPEVFVYLRSAFRP